MVFYKKSSRPHTCYYYYYIVPTCVGRSSSPWQQPALVNKPSVVAVRSQQQRTHETKEIALEWVDWEAVETAHNDNIYVNARGCKLQINKRESSLLVKWKIWIETKTTTVIDLGSIYNLSPSLFTTLSPLAIINTRHYYTKRAYLRVQNDCQVINDHLSNSSSCLIRGQTRKRLLSSSPSGVPNFNSTQLQRSIQSLPPKVNIILRPLPLPL